MATLAHVFIDNANVFGGAQRVGRTLRPAEPWPAVRVYYRNLFRLVEHGYLPGVRVMAGSVPPGNDELWRHAQASGYDTKLLRKVERDDGRLGEQAVDELLHLKMLEVIFDHEPTTLVLVTGDGNASPTGSSFLDQIQRALTRGWAINVWSWRAQLSGAFHRLAARSANFVQVSALDPHYESITFCKGGTYTVNGDSTLAVERIVSELRLPHA